MPECEDVAQGLGLQWLTPGWTSADCVPRTVLSRIREGRMWKAETLLHLNAVSACLAFVTHRFAA